jgi:beta-glucosidase/6-phospho-beta-glucosidase/beta-galactosidase
MRVVPTRTEGLPEVTEVIFYHDRITVCSAGQWVAIPFTTLARWPRPAWLRKALARFGYPPPWRLIADRDWVDTATESLFVFYSTPVFKLWLPYEPDYWTSSFFQLQQFLRQGGYDTFDMG